MEAQASYLIRNSVLPIENPETQETVSTLGLRMTALLLSYQPVRKTTLQLGQVGAILMCIAKKS